MKIIRILKTIFLYEFIVARWMGIKEMFKTKKFSIKIFKKYSLTEVVKDHEDLENRKISGPAVIIP